MLSRPRPAGAKRHWHASGQSGDASASLLARVCTARGGAAACACMLLLWVVVGGGPPSLGGESCDLVSCALDVRSSVSGDAPLDAAAASFVAARAFGPERRCVPGPDAAASVVVVGQGYGTWTLNLACFQLGLEGGAGHQGALQVAGGAAVGVDSDAAGGGAHGGTLRAAADTSIGGSNVAQEVMSSEASRLFSPMLQNVGALQPASVVYSFGIGGNVAFDLAMLQWFPQASVFAFDPTVDATSVAEVLRVASGGTTSESVDKRFRFRQWGIGYTDATLSFYKSFDPVIKSMSTMAGLPGYDPTPALQAPLRTLSSIMRELGHTWVDVLKLDVEGGEFDLFLRDPQMASFIPASQVLVEFHERLRPGGARTAEALALRAAVFSVLRAQGFRVLHVSDNGEEVCFSR